jgi:hypothetical protein
MKSKSPFEFASMVEEMAIKEAVEAGANDAAIAVIKQKFAKAKEQIKYDDNDGAGKGTEAGKHEADHRTGDEGSGGSNEQVGPPIL